jgi:hypothetical protein
VNEELFDEEIDFACDLVQFNSLKKEHKQSDSE